MRQLLSLFTIIFVCLIFLENNVHALVVGSNNSLQRQGSTLFPSSDSDNIILGYTTMEQGFTLQDNTTTCTFDAFFPVSGSIVLNGGSFHLTQDMILSNVATFTSLGSINGTNHLLKFSSLMTTFGSADQGLLPLRNIELQLNSNISLNGNIIFWGNSSIDGRGYELDMGLTASIVVAPGSSLSLQNMKVVGVRGQNISCQDDSSSIILDDVHGVFDNNFSFTKGSILINNYAEMSGTFTFSYESSQTSTISVNSTLKISDGGTLITGRYQPNWIVEPLEFVDQTSILSLDNCKLIINQNGIRFTKGRIKFMRDVAIDVMSTSTNNGVFLGNGTAAGDLVFDLDPAATMIFGAGHVFFDITSQNVIKSKSTTSRVTRKAGSYFYMNRPTISQNVSLETDVAITTIKPGVTLTYDNLVIIAAIGTFTVKGTQSNFFTINLNGNDYIKINSGFMPFYTLISNINNSIQGNGIVYAPITLFNNAAQLNLGVNGLVYSVIAMNNGAITLTTDLTFGANRFLIGDGTVHLVDNNLVLGSAPLASTNKVYWDGSDGAVILKNSLDLDNIWTFSGICTVNGQNNILDLKDGKIYIENGSTLTLKNITLKNLNGTNIQCLNNASKLIFDNAIIYQDDSFTFTLGSIHINNEARFRGNSIFAYQSPNKFTINAQSTLTLDQGVTFSYDPSQNNSPDLFVFADDTARLNIVRSNIHATLSGLNFKKGKIFIYGKCIFSSEINSTTDPITNNGISIGDQTSLNDVEFDITSNGFLEISQGSLNYKNFDATLWIMENLNSILLIQTAAMLRIYNSINLATGILQFADNGILAKRDTAQIIGSTIPLGNLIYASI